MPENKVSYGLKNVHYATFTVDSGVITYDTPIPLPGGVELSLDPRGEMVEFYADDMLYYSASNNQGYDGTFSIANIPEQFSIDALGEEKDLTDMVLTEKSTLKGKPFALLFEFDGDVKATRHVLYNCVASRPTISSSTKKSSAEPNPNELKFTSSPRETDYAVKTKTTPTTPTSVYDAWYDAVYTKNPDTTLPTITTSTPADAATGVAVGANLTVTFSEKINTTDVNDTMFKLIKSSDGTAVASTLTYNDTTKVVTIDPNANLAAATAYILVVSKGVRDLSGNKLAADYIINFTTA